MAGSVSRVTRWQWVFILACTVLAVACSVFFVGQATVPDRALIHVSAYAFSYLVAGAVALVRRPDNRMGAALLAIAAAGSVTLLGIYPHPFAGQLAGISGTVANILVAWVTLAAPTGRLAPGVSRWLLGAFAAVLLTANVVATAFFNLDVLRVLFAGGLVVSLLIAGVVVRRWLLASPASRRSLTPVAIAGVTISLIHAVDFATGVLLVPLAPGGPMYWADTLSRLLVPFGFLVGLLRLRMARGALAGLVVDLGETPPPERLREALGGALGDPTLEVLYWSHTSGGYLDADGVVVDPVGHADGRVVGYLEHAGKPLAAILHDPALAEDPGLVAAVAAAVRLAVDNERLNAEVEAQLDEVRASRARIIAAGDAERRRLERDLHDGAQQRIVSMTLALRLAQTRLAEDTDPAVRLSLRQASEDAKAALAELRELARGIHPQILTEAGLGPALDALGARAPCEVTVEIVPGDRYSAAVESAAYFVVSEALANVAKYAGATHALVRATWNAGVLTIEVTDDGIGGADPAAGSGLRGLVDRLAAINGTLHVASPRGGGTRLEARIPTPAAVPA